ncbi:Methyltransferase-like protein 23 [Trichoplax sp. H2]|nr:Methyltransferase-like protein 23 [Trichoplax sp. H2]|eukprot:RDD39998.1 Methyltransferase-like protein 23 [Trichoplax sp. H2]
MKTCKKFSFQDQDEHLEVTIEETIQQDYGLYIWPSAPVLAQYVWHNRQKLQSKSVLEIGAGTSLPGIVAARCGANVILSDSQQLVDALDACNTNLKLNNIDNGVVLGITWGQISSTLLELPAMDIILGSDCFYDSQDFEDILVTVHAIMQQNPNCQFWTTYQQRSCNRTIEHLLRKWDFKCQLVPLQSFHADGSDIAGFGMLNSPTVEMLKITMVS